MIGSIGFPEVVMIFIVVLLLFGPKKLPEFARLMGKTVREFRKTINDAKASIEEEIDKADLSELKAIDRDIKEAARLDKIIENTAVAQDLNEFKELSQGIKDITRFDDDARKREQKRERKRDDPTGNSHEEETPEEEKPE